MKRMCTKILAMRGKGQESLAMSYLKASEHHAK